MTNDNARVIHAHCNTIPAWQDQDSWRRRLLVVNSQHRRPEKIIPDLGGTILREESSGVLNWLIEGAEAHKKELAEFGSYQLTRRQRQEIDRMVHAPAEVKVGKR
jgi:phage/plasmid-associated DNA primase